MIVERILVECAVTEAPVPLRTIAKHLGLKISKAYTDDDYSGFLHRPAQQGPTIGINASQSPVRQNFTIAHEIGHFLLHAAAEFHVDGEFRTYRRDSRSAEGVDRTEVEANAFAAELLMPHKFLMRDIAQIDGINLTDEAQLKTLAAKYGVSAQAMTFRLGNLGHITL